MIRTLAAITSILWSSYIFAATNDEIVDIYNHLDVLIKKRTRIGKLTPAQFFTLIKHPTSTLNFIQGRKVPFNDLEKFKNEVQLKS